MVAQRYQKLYQAGLVSAVGSPSELPVQSKDLGE